MLKDFILKNFILILEMVGLLILLKTSVAVSKKTTAYTYASLALLFINTILYNIEFWTRSFETYTVARPILSSCVYTIQPLILLMAMSIGTPLSKNQLWLLIPEAVCIPLYFSSQWTHIVFYYTNDNSFTRGPLSYLPYFVFAFYALLFGWQVIFKFKKKHLFDGSLILVILLTALLGVILYFINDIDDYNVIFSTGILLYYLFYYIQIAKTDPLTGLLNRQSYIKDLDEEKRKISAAVSVDMNDLKKLNDEFGHSAGDEGLIAVSRCIVKGSRKKKVYRVGGDEFTILYTDCDEQHVVDDIELMRSELAKTKYVCAFGYAISDEKTDMHALLRDADNAMYAEKARLKMGRQ